MCTICAHVNPILITVCGDYQRFIQKFLKGGGIKNFLGSCGGKHMTSVLYLEVPRGGGGGGGGGGSPLLEETLKLYNLVLKARYLSGCAFCISS